MTVLAFKNPSSADKPKRRRSGTLTVVATPKGKLPFKGQLAVGSTTVEAADGNRLGLAAFVMNVSSVVVRTPSIKTTVKLSTRGSGPREVQALCESKGATKREEGWFLKRFETALSVASSSAKEPLSLMEWWGKKFLPGAVKLVPVEQRVHASFARAASYDEKGIPHTAKQLEAKARHKRMIGMLTGETPIHDVPLIPWEHIKRMEDPHGPVAINGPAYLAVQRALKAYQFPRTPDSYAELRAGLNFCEAVACAISPIATGKAEAFRMRASKKVRREHFPDVADLFDACVDGDVDLVKKLQAKKDWLPLMAAYFNAEADEVLGGPHP